MKTTLSIRTILFLFSFVLIGSLYAQSGTADGVYNFSALGAPNSGGTGFKTQGDKFKVSNVFVQDRKTMYVDNANPGEPQTIIIKAEGSGTNKNFSFKDLVLRNYSQNAELDIFTITLRGQSGAQIARLALADNQLLGLSPQAISSFSFDGPFPAAGFDGVAEIQVDFHYADNNISPDEMTFQSITIANVSNAFPLPLTLLDFSAKKEGSGVRVSWSTASETNVAHHVIEHSTDGSSFTAIASFRGQKSTTVKTAYTFFHTKPSVGKNYYRLKEVDDNGSEKVFIVRSVDIDRTESIVIKTSNPVNGPVLIQGLSAGVYDVNLIDMNGRIVVSSKVSNNAGNYQFVLPAAVPKGTYVLVITGGSRPFSQKIIRQ